MQGFMITLLVCSVTMSALALFYMALTPLLARRYSVTGCYYTWLVIVAGLIVPFRPHFNSALIKVDVTGNPVFPVIPTGGGRTVVVPVKNVIPFAVTDIPWWQIAAALWLMGMVIFLTHHVLRHCRFLKLVARWSTDITDEQTLSLIQDLKAEMGLTKNIGLQRCDSIGSPLMIGFVKPLILLPSEDFTKEELCFILKHELVHYKRKDLWFKGFVLIATAIHWFNPIVYLMAGAIGNQCELSCDKEVVRSADAGTRLYYSETIIGVVRSQSKLKTDLSTNFYGGKKGMKNRIVSIMDMSKKKAGLPIACGVLMFTLGTGFAFSANAGTQDSSVIKNKNIQEDMVFGYGFLPDPELYSRYSSQGITISEDGKTLFYNGQRVRLFVDEHSNDQAFFVDEEGTLDLCVNRNADGRITGIENISKQKAQEYRIAFFADDINVAEGVHEQVNEQEGVQKGVNEQEGVQKRVNEQEYAGVQEQVSVQDTVKAQETAGGNKYGQYSAYGISLSSDGGILYHGSQRVKLLVDVRSDGSFDTFWYDEAGTDNLSVVRNGAGQITSIDGISEEQAQKYRLALEE